MELLMTKPIEPVNLIKLVHPVKPTNTIKPVNPAKPVHPIKPVNPITVALWDLQRRSCVLCD